MTVHLPRSVAVEGTGWKPNHRQGNYEGFIEGFNGFSFIAREKDPPVKFCYYQGANEMHDGYVDAIQEFLASSGAQLFRELAKRRNGSQ